MWQLRAFLAPGHMVCRRGRHGLWSSLEPRRVTETLKMLWVLAAAIHPIATRGAIRSRCGAAPYRARSNKEIPYASNTASGCPTWLMFRRRSCCRRHGIPRPLHQLDFLDNALVTASMCLDDTFELLDALPSKIIPRPISPAPRHLRAGGLRWLVDWVGL